MAAPATNINPMAMKMAAQQLSKSSKLAGTIDEIVNLNGLVKTVKVLNRSDKDSTIADLEFGTAQSVTPAGAQFIMSDADEELLLLYEFRELIDLESIAFFACKSKDDKKQNDGDDDDDDEEADYSAPKQIFVYKVDSLNKDFSDALAAKADIKLVADEKKLKSKRGQSLKLKTKAKTAVKFTKFDKLMMYIASNQGETEQTYISGIRFYGNSSAKTDMSRWNEVKCKS